MIIFFDTEFTGLTSDPSLLSIGLVAEDGQELYIEFTNGWTEERCSLWTREHVLPLLGDGEKLTRRDGATRIVSWLRTLEEAPMLLGDTDWDTTLLRNLMDEFGTDSNACRIELLTMQSREQALVFEAAKRDWFDRQGAKPHHALTDARAFLDVYKQVFNTAL